MNKITVKKMKRQLSLLALVAAAALGANAGGLLHNTNQHIDFVRMMARGASNEIDAVYTNPAGLAFMDHDGWSLSLNIQSANQKRNVDAIVKTPAGMGLFENDTYKRLYEGKAVAPVVPSVYAAYKTPKWVISGFIGITGGGGKCTFNDGLPLFDVAVMAGLYQGSADLAPLLGGPIGPSNYNIDGYMRGQQYIYGGQVGFTYKFTDFLSAYVGGRANFLTGNYKGHVNATAKKDYAAKMLGVASAIGGTNPAVAQLLTSMAGENGLAHIAIDCDQTGWGFTPILGVDFKWKGLTVAAKYEFKTKLNIENDTKTLEAPGAFEKSLEPYKHGVNTPNDLPSVLYLAAGYEFIPETLRGTLEYHYYGDKHAGMAGDKQKTLKHGTHEYLTGVEWDINKRFTVSCGAQITDYGLSDEYQSNTSFACDSYSIGFGGAVNITPKLKLNVGYFWTSYKDYKKDMPNGYNGISAMLPGTDTYSRSNKVFGMGIDFKF